MKWAVVVLAVCVTAAVYAAWDLSRTLNRALRLPDQED